MPIYEYECDACGHSLDALQKMSEAPLTDCPACGKPMLRKRVSAPRFRLKGAGWYETDFKQGNRRNLAEGGDGGSSSGSGSTSNSDTKAAKPETEKKEKKTDGDSGGGAAPKPTASNDA